MRNCRSCNADWTRVWHVIIFFRHLFSLDLWNFLIHFSSKFPTYSISSIKIYRIKISQSWHRWTSRRQIQKFKTWNVVCYFRCHATILNVRFFFAKFQICCLFIFQSFFIHDRRILLKFEWTRRILRQSPIADSMSPTPSSLAASRKNSFHFKWRPIKTVFSTWQLNCT